jgi:hypothetical protein
MREAREQRIERVLRPVTWAYMLCGFTLICLLGMWRDGEIEMTIPLAVSAGVLAAVAGLLLWATRRIANALR